MKRDAKSNWMHAPDESLAGCVLSYAVYAQSFAAPANDLHVEMHHEEKHDCERVPLSEELPAVAADAMNCIASHLRLQSR
jgi:hypothetical protein